MQERPQWTKVNIYRVCLIFLTPIYWALIGFGVLWILFNFLTGLFDFATYGATPLSVFARYARYDLIYIGLLAFVYYLRKFIQKLSKKQDGVDVPDEKINYRKEIFFVAKVYLSFLGINYISMYLSIFVLAVFGTLMRFTRLF